MAAAQSRLNPHHGVKSATRKTNRGCTFCAASFFVDATRLFRFLATPDDNSAVSHRTIHKNQGIRQKNGFKIWKPESKRLSLHPQMRKAIVFQVCKS
jgi:hypothetical protein